MHCRRERAGRKPFACRTRWLAAAATAVLVAGASQAVTYAEADVAPWLDFGSTFGEQTLLPLDADVVEGVSQGGCPAPFFCVVDSDYFSFRGLAPGTGFSIAFETLGSPPEPPIFVFYADHADFRVYDEAGHTLFAGTHRLPDDPLSFTGVVPVSGQIVVLAFGPDAIDELIPFTAPYRVSLDAQLIPEPATALLVGAGLAALGAGRRRSTPGRARGPAPRGRGPRTG